MALLVLKCTKKQLRELQKIPYPMSKTECSNLNFLVLVIRKKRVLANFFENMDKRLVYETTLNRCGLV